MKIVIIAAVAGFGLAIGTAFAGEGAGDPFPFRAPGVVTNTTGRAVLPGANTDPYPFRANGTTITTTMSEQITPTNGAEGTVQTANSLPLNFANGTVAYTQEASVERYRAAQLASRVNAARLAQHQAAVMPNRG
jgi:hypothetical protein